MNESKPPAPPKQDFASNVKWFSRAEAKHLIENKKGPDSYQAFLNACGVWPDYTYRTVFAWLGVAYVEA